MSPTQYSRAIVLLADGARADIMGEMLAAGRLPNIARHLVEPGSVLQAVTSFPSTTGPAYLPFLTGCLPGTCNIPGIRWFDKAKYDSGWSFDRYRSYVGLESFCMGRDMWPHIRTIFELIPNSYSIFNPIARGARGGRNVTRISRIWHWYYAHQTDRWAAVDEAALAKLSALLVRRPRFVFAVFPGIDEYSHLTHPHHEKVIERYGWLDRAIGRLVGELEGLGIWAETALFLVSDHGLSKTGDHFCVNGFLEKRNLPPFFYPLIFDKRGKVSANMVSGNGMTHIYFKNRDGWSRHTVRSELEGIAPGLLDDLLAKDAIDVAICRNADGGADILSRRGGARVRLDGDHLHYELDGGDPFGYLGVPADMDPNTCLEATWDTEYPDAPFQVAHLVTSPRAGDVILSAAPGYDLRLAYENPEHRASHGSLCASHMRVPLISNVRLKNRPVRTVDLFPTVLGMLGCNIPGYVDGVPIA